MNPMTQAPPEEEEDTDYDLFASVRPEGTTTPSKQSEQPEEDLDLFADARPDVEEIVKTKETKRQEEENVNQVEDVVKQGTKNLLIGIGGTYGDLAELAGVKAKETPGQEARSSAEHDVLTKMKEPGYKPSFYDLEALSNEGEGPGAFNLPTSKSLEEFNELSGGPGEPKSRAGRYSARALKLTGSSIAFGGINPTGPVLAAGAGQTVEELGGGPILQAAAEIATLLLAGGKGVPNATNKKEVADKINKLRQLGYTEEQITLAINSASRGKKFGKRASKGSKTEQAFEDFAEHSDEVVKDILSQEIPGYEKGIKNIHEMASDAYGEVAKQASGIVVKDPKPFKDAVKTVINEIKKNLDVSEEAKAFIKRLNKAVAAAEKNPSAENYMNFYKELNAAGKWMGRNQKDTFLTKVKNGIKDSFKANGEEGVVFANKFEKVNAGIRKAYQAEEVYELLQKTVTQEGRDFKKLHKVFDKEKNVKLLNDVLGEKQAKNLKFIAQQGKEIKDFNKAWKTTSFLSTATDTARGIGAAYYLYKGDFEGLAAVLATKVGAQAAAALAEQMLTNPRFQSLYIRALNGLKNEAPTAFKSANDAMQKLLDEEGIDVKLN